MCKCFLHPVEIGILTSSQLLDYSILLLTLRISPIRKGTRFSSNMPCTSSTPSMSASSSTTCVSPSASSTFPLRPYESSFPRRDTTSQAPPRPLRTYDQHHTAGMDIQIHGIAYCYLFPSLIPHNPSSRSLGQTRNPLPPLELLPLKPRNNLPNVHGHQTIPRYPLPRRAPARLST